MTFIISKFLSSAIKSSNLQINQMDSQRLKISFFCYKELLIMHLLYKIQILGKKIPIRFIKYCHNILMLLAEDLSLMHFKNW